MQVCQYWCDVFVLPQSCHQRSSRVLDALQSVLLRVVNPKQKQSVNT